jgi:hypothetical protein
MPCGDLRGPQDALELCGHEMGRDSRYRKKGGGGGGKGGKGEAGEEAPRVLSHALPAYSEATLRSLERVDEEQVRGAGREEPRAQRECSSSPAHGGGAGPAAQQLPTPPGLQPSHAHDACTTSVGP